MLLIEDIKDRINHNSELRNTGITNAADTVSLPRHRWYYYKEGFSPTLVEKAMESAGVTNDEIVLDIFNGSGTTTLTASSKGYKAIGIEVNPFTCFLSKTKTKNVNLSEINQWQQSLNNSAEKSTTSPLIGFSTFSETENLQKWLFNKGVLTAFEGAWEKTEEISSHNIRRLLRLALISSAMENCNATKDGKCLRYRPTWKNYGFDKNTFLQSFEEKLEEIIEDIEGNPIKKNAVIINGDSRKRLSSNNSDLNFKLCITSPPYLNTFDYTDIYRPELFLGKFVQSNKELYKLRLKTVRSHIQAKWKDPKLSDFGIVYNQVINHVKDNQDKLMDKKIPLMIQAYFEDMFNILRLLKTKAEKNAQVWLVVSNSAYANTEIPVDFIIGELGTKAGWFLKDIAVLEHIKRRKTKHSPDISYLRESVIILTNSQKLK
jgi:DNA modification methylase